MIRIVLLAVAVAAGILALGYLLIPRGAERALISLRNQEIGEAVAQYELRYAEGDRSVGTLSALARIYESQGRIQAAARLAGELAFAYADPNLALRREAAIYRAGQQFGRAVQVLQEIPPADRTVDELQWLIGQYGLYGRMDRLVENLHALVARGAAEPDQAVELARILAAQQRFAEAVAVLRKEDAVRQAALPTVGQALMIRLLVADGELEEARDRVETWAREDATPIEVLAFAAEQFRAAGAPEEAISILLPWEAEAVDAPPLQAALVESWIAAGRLRDALTAMRIWQDEDALDPSLRPRLADVALLEGDYRAARAAIAREAPETFGPGLLAAFVDAAQRRGDLTDIRDLDARLAPEFLNREPVLAAVIAFALGERERALRAAERGARQARSADDRQVLASLLRELGRTGEALALLRDVPRPAQMTQGYLTQLASTYLADGRVPEGLALFERLRQEAEGGRAMPGWAILAAAAGQEQAVRAWLAARPELSADVLRDLNAAAVAAGIPALALETAERLSRLDDGTDARLRLAAALRMSDRPQEALDLLAGLPADDPAVRSERIEVLTALGDLPALRRIYASVLADPAATEAEKDQAAFDLLASDGAAEALDYLERRAAETPAADGEEPWLFAFADAAQQAGATGRLAGFLERQLGRPDLSEAQRQTRLSLLIEHAPDQAADYLAGRAGQGGIWAEAYQELLRQRGDRSALTALLLQRGTDPAVPAETRREAAFGLLDLGGKQDAIRVFQSLAAGTLPTGQDVQQLAYLWGPRPGPAALDWVEAQALAAGGPARADWLDLLGRLGGGPRLIELVAAGRVTQAEAGEAWLGALLRAGRIAELRPALAAALERAETPERLRSLAGIAERAGLQELAERAWERVLATRPDDPEALRRLAGFAAADGRYAAARSLLLRYIALARPDYADLYALAEAERALGMTGEAQARYRQAAALIDAQPEPGFDARIVRALIAHRLGRSEEAVERFGRLYAERPQDLSLRDDFAEVLLDLGHIGQARALLQ